MADNSPIEWTDATWNPVTGCSVVSPGCTNCYAMQLAGTRLKNHPSRAGLTQDTKAGPVWTGEVRFNADWLDQPLRWKRPRKIFVCAHGDLFHEAVPDEWIDKVFAVMALAPQHIFQVLTKRAERMRDYFTRSASRWEDDPYDRKEAVYCEMRLRQYIAREELPWPLPNVWLGFSAEDQDRLVERWRPCGELAEQGWLIWCSAEPLLGPLDLFRVEVVAAKPESPRPGIHVNVLNGKHYESGVVAPGYKLSWVVAGGESGPNARPMHPDWARSLRDQCQAAGVPFFYKQHGEWTPDVSPHIPAPLDRLMHIRNDGLVATADEADRIEAREGHQNWKQVARVGKKAAGRLLDGREHSEMPA